MVGRQKPHLNAAGRSWLLRGGEAEDTRLARACLSTSSREWEGNGVSHDARKDVKLTADVGARILILISREVAGISDSCNLLSACD